MFWSLSGAERAKNLPYCSCCPFMTLRSTRAEQQALNYSKFLVLVGTHVPRPTTSPVEYCRTPPNAGDTREVEDDTAEEIRRHTAIIEVGSRSHLPQRYIVAIGVEVVECRPSDKPGVGVSTPEIVLPFIQLSPTLQWGRT